LSVCRKIGEIQKCLQQKEIDTLFDILRAKIKKIVKNFVIVEKEYNQNKTGFIEIKRQNKRCRETVFDIKIAILFNIHI
jgi:hypothetical protein